MTVPMASEFLGGGSGLLQGRSLRAYIVSTGAGSGLQGSLWSVPGASSFLVGSEFPYAPDATERFLGFRPDQFCSEATAVDLAMEAFRRAFVQSGPPAVGVGLTGSVASVGPHRGDHRVHAACVSDLGVKIWTGILPKGAGLERRHLDGLLSDCVGLHALLEGAGIAHDLDALGGALDGFASFSGRDGSEDAMRSVVERPLFTSSGRRERAPSNGSGLTFLPGAFNPPHEGHVYLAQEHGAIFQLTVDPPHKDGVTVQQVLQRLKMLDGHSLLVTRGDPLFLDKARRFPGACFLVGVDTFRRMMDPGWGHSVAELVEEFRRLGVRFLVADREVDGRITALPDVLESNPSIPRDICRRVLRPAQHLGMSSTAIREAVR